MASSAAYECDAEEQTVDHVALQSGVDWPFGHLDNARWAAAAESKMDRSHRLKNELFHIQKAYNKFVCNILYIKYRIWAVSETQWI